MRARNRILASLAAIVVLVTGSAALATSTTWYADTPGAVPLTSRMTWSASPSRAPALDAPIYHRRAITEAEATRAYGAPRDMPRRVA